MDCRKCDVEMKPSKAIQQTFTGGSPDMGAVVTFSAGGAGKIVECLKCPSCGHSVNT